MQQAHSNADQSPSFCSVIFCVCSLISSKLSSLGSLCCNSKCDLSLSGCHHLGMGKNAESQASPRLAELETARQDLWVIVLGTSESEKLCSRLGRSVAFHMNDTAKPVCESPFHREQVLNSLPHVWPQHLLHWLGHNTSH